MSLEDDLAILSDAPLFSLLDQEALRVLAFAAESRSLRAGDVLFHKGDRSDGGYVVVRGSVALDATDNGSPASFIAGPGSLIGQVALFVRLPRPATAIAREPTAVLRISPTLMRRVLEQFPSAAENLHAEMARELSDMTAGLERMRGQLLAVGEKA